VADVIMSSGNQLGVLVRATRDRRGWISISVTPDLVYAMALGDQTVLR